mgnify:CR=1 FL=1|tara:strand:+ start:161 stop:313 length:153 start_codon:yes stop_codon:yes gene_type:complete
MRYFTDKYTIIIDLGIYKFQILKNFVTRLLMGLALWVNIPIFAGINKTNF